MTASDEQSHRSIGEVLSLLQEEFPDVTISKIRFLESQGLVAPERTASGFRKFYDSDIQRLRWILRKQSDHFLPLKVIKKMLDEGADTSVIDDVESQQTLWPMEGRTAAASGDVSPGVGSGGPQDTDTATFESQTVSPSNGSVTDEAQPGRPSVPEAEPAPGGAAKPRRDTTTERTRRPSPSHPSIVGRRMVEESSGRADGDRNNGDGSGAGGPDDTGAVSEVRGTDGPAEAGADAERSKPIMTPADIVAALQEDPRPGGRARGVGRRRGDAEDRDAGRVAEVGVRQFSVEDLTDTSDRAEFLSAEEVCEMFDIEQSLLDDIEKFGLIAPRRYGGAASFDGTDIEIIGVAVRYASMGVEPRHLRMYKIAAEREAGFVEQLVVPILKQRNPAAKQNAAERASQLASMGDELHNLILRRHLRNLLDNR